jgi:snRNA-activating protein complex subunit 3
MDIHLSNAASLDTSILKCEGMPSASSQYVFDSTDVPFVKANIHLETIRELIDAPKAHDGLNLLDNSHHQNHSSLSNSASLLPSLLPASSSSSPPSSDHHEKDEVVLSVAIYHPHKEEKSQEFLVLSSQTLDDLRSRIICPLEKQFYQLHPIFEDTSFFFIENKFILDSKNPKKDNSKLIRSWNPTPNVSYAHDINPTKFSVQTMSEVAFNDLDIKLQFPYLFSHRGDCEHIFMFTDMRMVSRCDPSFKQDYPHLLFKNRGQLQHCKICTVRAADIALINDALTPENPCFVCTRCNDELHRGQLCSGDVIQLN